MILYPVSGDKYIKLKIRLYGDDRNTNFHKKENVSYKYLSVLMLESVVKARKKHYPQTLLEACKHEIKKKKIKNLINYDLDSSSSDESDNDKSDNDESND